MSKQLFFLGDNANVHRGNNDAALNGVAVGWRPYCLAEVRGTTAQGSSADTVAGPTNGVEINLSTNKYEWLSEPLAADFTISGTITLNLWCSESNASANAAINAVIEKMDCVTGALTQIAKTARTTELGTSVAAANFTVTPTSTVCKHGDRLRVRVYADDAASNMGASQTMSFFYGGPTGGANGDSYIQFTENLTFDPPPGPGMHFEAMCNTSGTGFGTGLATGSTTITSQPFVAKGTQLIEVAIGLAKSGAPVDNLVLAIETNSGGNPSGTVVGTVATVSGASLGTSLSTATYVFSCNIALTQGTIYHLTYRRSGALNSSNYFLVKTAGNNLPPLLPVLVYNGTTWAAQGAGVVFAALRAANISSYYLTDTNDAFISYIESATTPASVATIGDAAAQTAQAESFVAVGNLTEVWLWINKSGAPADNVVVEVQSDSAGSPSGTVIGTVATLAGSSVTTNSISFSEFVMPCNISLTKGATYWIVVRRSGAIDAGNFFMIGWVSGTPTGGVWKRNSGAGWVTQTGNSLTFRFTSSMPVKKASTTRGSGVVNSITNTAAGPTAGIQVTDTAGGNVLEWYTPPLQAISFGGKSKFFIRAKASAGFPSLKAEIAVCNGDGSGAVVWGIGCLDVGPNANLGGIISTEGMYGAFVAGDDVSITAGQRLRFRIYLDDNCTTVLAAGNTVTVAYNGVTAWATGDTYVALPVNVVEQIVTTPISDTDTNSTTTESGAVNNASLIGTEPGGPETETTSIVYSPFTVSDVNSAVTESTIINQKFSDVDSATASESASVSIKLSLSDTDVNGVTNETTTQVARPSSNDVNSVTIESVTTVAQPSVADNNSTVTENTTPVAKLSDVDANATTAENTSTATITPIAASDTNAGVVEVTSQISKIPTTDTDGAITESASITQIQLTSTDANNVLTENTAQTAQGSVADVNGVTTENGTTATTLQVAASDSNAGVSEVTSQVSQIPASDTDGATSEIAGTTSILQISGTDTNGISVESITQTTQTQASDANAPSVENATTASINQISASDVSGPVVESASITKIQMGVLDTNSSTAEVVSLRYMVSDVNGTTDESASLSTTTFKVGTDGNSTFTDTAFTTRIVPVNDTNSAVVEAAISRPTLVDVDVVISFELATPTARLSDIDFATSTELANAVTIRVSTTIRTGSISRNWRGRNGKSDNGNTVVGSTGRNNKTNGGETVESATGRITWAS